MASNKPISVIRTIIGNLPLKIFWSIFLCLFLGVALPAHHHDDGLNHSDCAFCVVQKSTPPVEGMWSLPVVFDIVTELTQPPLQRCYPILVLAFNSRAPHV
jgi:hypothetical protein